MGISIKTDLEIGQLMYVKVDPYQTEHQLVAVVIMPNKGLRFRLSYQGEVTELWDFECSTERDELKFLESKKSEDDD